MASKQRVDATNASIAPRNDYARTIAAIVEGGFCPFCEEHLFKHHKKPILVRGEHWLVTESTWPYEGTETHLLFIIRSHVEKIEELSPAAWTELQILHAKMIAAHRITGGTLMIRSGETRFTGATVNHLHAHLIVGGPREEGNQPITAVLGFNNKK
jgi:diadenosine tetraphosphate (Ap4A) HIT family hydrolase